MPKRRPFGFLICGLVIGLCFGVVAVKRWHLIEALIVGPILGVVAGILIELAASRRTEPPNFSN